MPHGVERAICASSPSPADIGRLDDADARKIVTEAQDPHPATVDQMVLRRIVGAKGRGRGEVAGRCLEAVPRVNPVEVAKQSAGASQQRVVETLETEGSRDRAATAGGVDEKWRSCRLGSILHPLGEAPKPHRPACSLALDRLDDAILPRRRASADGRCMQKQVDICPQPVGIATGIGGTGGYEQRRGVVGSVAEGLAATVMEIGKTPLFAAADVGIGRLPRSPPGQGGKFRQLVAGSEIGEDQICCRCARFANREPWMTAAVDDQHAHPTRRENPGQQRA